MKIAFVDLLRQYQENREAIDSQIREVLQTSNYILGPKVQEIETKLAALVGVRHAIGVSSGTDALLLALMATGLKPGDEVITTPFTFMATAEVVALLGGVPVFVDIEPDTYNISPELIEGKITGRTRAIIPVDLFGQCAEYDRINEIARRHGLVVREDAAQSFGAFYKGRAACSLGDIGCTSFYPAKPLGCYGDGGMVFTNDDKLAELVDSLHVHGQGSDRYENIRIGICGRLDAIQAAVLLGKLPALAKEMQRREKAAEYYSQRLRHIATVPAVRPHNKPAWGYYCIRVKNRDSVRERLSKAGVPTAVFYPIPLHLQKAFGYLGCREGDMPVSEVVARDILALPMHAYLDVETQNVIIKQIEASVES